MKTLPYTLQTFDRWAENNFSHIYFSWQFKYRWSLFTCELITESLEEN